MASTASREPAKVLASRLNAVPIALFSLWLGPMLMFWGQAFGPLRPFDTPAPTWTAYPWLAASLPSGAAVLLLPAAWYRIFPAEASGRLYIALGARACRRFVTNGDYVNRIVARRHPKYRGHPYSERLDAAMKTSISSERSHLVAFAAGLSPVLYATLIGWTGWAMWLAATNIACNLYPVLVQRDTRARLKRIQRRRLRPRFG